MRVLIAALSFLLCAFPAQKKNIKIHGYVTAVHSQNSFEIDDYRINRDASLNLEFEKQGNEDKEAVADPDPIRDIRVGTEVEIKGEYDSEAHELRAKSIKVLPSELKKVKRTALVETLPDIHNRGGYWEGAFRVDGQRLLVDEITKLTIVLNKEQKKAQKKADATKKAAKTAQEAPATAIALARLDDVHRNMFVSYEGLRQADGTIRALKLEFTDNELTSGEAKLRKSLTPTVKPFKSEKPGELQIRGVGKFKTVPNEEVQQYAQQMGESLVPANQKELATGDPNKIPFQFFVIENNAPNAFACASGAVVVHSGLFRAVENEAQMAFVIGHEIAHATQEHTMREMQFHRKKRILLGVATLAAGQYGAYNLRNVLELFSASITNGYSRYLENQADRLGMEYMLAAGYDPREAARAWKALSLKYGDYPMIFFWSSHDNNTTRRSYLMAELRNSYQGVEFGSKRRDGEEFRRLVQFLQSREESGKKIKVKY